MRERVEKVLLRAKSLQAATDGMMTGYHTYSDIKYASTEAGELIRMLEDLEWNMYRQEKDALGGVRKISMAKKE